MSKNYHFLGKLPADTVSFFKHEILQRNKKHNPNVRHINDSYQWVHFDDYLHNEFLKIFINTDLKIQWWKEKDRPTQKAFVVEPGAGMRIHKDGMHCKAALNIAISCNPNDWVRWYDEDTINSLGNVVARNDGEASSRNVDITDFESVEYTEEVHNSEGDVYIVNTDVYHSFKCNGTDPRIIIQTKFDKWPDFETVKESLTKNSFINLL